MCSEASSFFDSFFLVQSRLNSCSDLIIWVWNTLWRRLSCSGFEVLMTFAACILGEIYHGLQSPLLVDLMESTWGKIHLNRLHFVCYHAPLLCVNLLLELLDFGICLCDCFCENLILDAISITKWVNRNGVWRTSPSCQSVRSASSSSSFRTCMTFLRRAHRVPIVFG